MTVGFFNVYRGDPVHLVLADLMIRSVREVMPGVPVVQFTDETSPAAYGVDEVRRLPKQPRAVLCVEHYAGCKGDWLLVDTDVIIQKDVRVVFNDDFDVAVTDREGTMVEGEMEEEFHLFDQMPHNIGVVFSRCPTFWGAVQAKMESMN